MVTLPKTYFTNREFSFTLKDDIYIREALNIIKRDFEEYAIKQQDFMGDEKKWAKVLALIPSEALRKVIEGDMEKKADSASRWARLQKYIREIQMEKEYRDSRRADDEIMLQYCYPRLDVNVSIGVNHLLKSPFCIHPKTGRVCVPMDPDAVDSFSPMAVPTITQLLDELDSAESSAVEESGKRQKDYKRTTLASSLEVFERFLKKLENSQRGKLLQESDKKMEF
nr:hypothetical protein BaRGS_028443 [Batillaria attramentaria]